MAAKSHFEHFTRIRGLLPKPLLNGNQNMIEDGRLELIEQHLEALEEQLQSTEAKRIALYEGYSAKCERWSLGTCDVYHDDREPCRICAFFVGLGYESFEVSQGGLRSWRPVKESNPANTSEPEAATPVPEVRTDDVGCVSGSEVSEGSNEATKVEDA